jgi:nickel/cobalt exporter
MRTRSMAVQARCGSGLHASPGPTTIITANAGIRMISRRESPSPSPSPQGGGESRAAGCTCGGHHADPATLAKPGLSGALAAVLSVGLRPCTGALVVLAFALAQGIFWAGIASTLLMAFGTAIAVAALAALAVGAKDVAARLTQGDGRRSGQVMLALEIVAALFIAVFGATLFVGTLAV